MFCAFRPSARRRIASALVLVALAAVGATLSAQQQVVPRHQRQHRVGHVLSRRRSVPAAAERTLERGLDAESAAPARGCQRLPHRRSARHRSIRCAASKMNADAWVGLFKSFDGGQTWRSTLLPGYPAGRLRRRARVAAQGPRRRRPIPVMRAGTNGLFYYAGVAFDRGDNKPSAIFVARFIDLNNNEAGDPIVHLSTPASSTASAAHASSTSRRWPRTSRASAATCTIQAPLGMTGPTSRPDHPGRERLRRLRRVHRVRAPTSIARSCSRARPTAASRGARRSASQRRHRARCRTPRSPSIPAERRGLRLVARVSIRYAGRRGHRRQVDRRRRNFGKAVRVAGRPSLRPGHQPHLVPDQWLPDDGDRRDRARLRRVVGARPRDRAARPPHRRRPHRHLDVGQRRDVDGAAADPDRRASGTS